MLTFHFRRFSSVDTIFALATARGKAGIGVLRISGSNTRRALQELLSEHKYTQVVESPRKLFICKFTDSRASIIIDKGLVAFFGGPKSFTGEDVAEMYIHSSSAVVSALYHRLGQIPGLRVAEPGEFSRRAFHNGKLDLNQLEGLADLLAAETESQRRLAMLQLDGAMGRKFREWRERIIVVLAMTEAWIDFSEDELIENETLENVVAAVQRLSVEVEDQLGRMKVNEIARNGFQIVLCGPPNAGKSSILNTIVQRDAAIVSPIAGTTRDILQINMDVNGQPVVISDTAGIHDSCEDIIEQEGIKRAKAAADNADHVLFVVDANELALSGRIAKEITCFDPCRLTLVLNKIDLNMEVTTDLAKSLLPTTHQSIGIWPNSTLDSSLERMREYITSLVAHKMQEMDDPTTIPVIMNERQKTQAIIALTSLNQFLATYETDIVIGAEHLRQAASSIGRITGHIDSEQIFDVLFGNFCIGK